jgi:hypothetical protein
MNLYCLIRRSGWTAESLTAGAARSEAEGAKRPDQVRHIRSYVLDEADGRVGTICVYQAVSEQAVLEHAAAAGLPAPDVVQVSAVNVVRPDPEAVSA